MRIMSLSSMVVKKENNEIMELAVFPQFHPNLHCDLPLPTTESPSLRSLQMPPISVVKLSFILLESIRLGN